MADVTCPRCNGQGKYWKRSSLADRAKFGGSFIKKNCDYCKGKGKLRG